MTWAQIRQAFLSAVGDSEAARADLYLCLSEGYRDIASNPDVEIPEMNAYDESVIVLANTDFVETSTLSPAVYAILDGFNVTEGFEIFPEPGGMVGRNRFLDETGKPTTGNITNYQRDGTRLYVRNTPTVDTTLRFRVRQQVPDVTAAMLNDSPITPRQYDLKIVYAAAEVFFNLHPKTEGEGSAAIVYSQKYKMAKLDGLAQLKPSPAHEDKSRRETMRLSGYRMSPRSRR